MSAHTPGPWEWGRDMGFFWVETEKDGYNVASVTNHNDKRENEANARLIAAAPELLEMALELKTELELIAMEEGAEPYNNPRLNAVLAKATGAA